MSDAMVKALLEERERHKSRGRDARVKLVDAELAKFGHRVEPDEPETPERPEPTVETTSQAKPPENTAAPRARDHVCQCGRKFSSAAALGSHQRTHRDER